MTKEELKQVAMEYLSTAFKGVRVSGNVNPTVISAAVSIVLMP